MRQIRLSYTTPTARREWGSAREACLSAEDQERHKGQSHHYVMIILRDLTDPSCLCTGLVSAFKDKTDQIKYKKWDRDS
jgi:hypothetical protein